MILQDISEYSEQLMLTSFIGAYWDFFELGSGLKHS